MGQESRRGRDWSVETGIEDGIELTQEGRTKHGQQTRT